MIEFFLMRGIFVRFCLYMVIFIYKLSLVIYVEVREVLVGGVVLVFRFGFDRWRRKVFWVKF